MPRKKTEIVDYENIRTHTRYSVKKVDRSWRIVVSLGKHGKVLPNIEPQTTQIKAQLLLDAYAANHELMRAEPEPDATTARARERDVKNAIIDGYSRRTRKNKEI